MIDQQEGMGIHAVGDIDNLTLSEGNRALAHEHALANALHHGMHYHTGTNKKRGQRKFLVAHQLTWKWFFF